MNDKDNKINNLFIIDYFNLLYHSPCTFSNKNPRDNPIITILKHKALIDKISPPINFVSL